MKNLKGFKKFAISQKSASIVSGGSGSTRYCCGSCSSTICGTNAKAVQLECLDSLPPRPVLVVCN